MPGISNQHMEAWGTKFSQTSGWLLYPAVEVQPRKGLIHPDGTCVLMRLMPCPACSTGAGFPLPANLNQNLDYMFIEEPLFHPLEHRGQ